MSDNAYYGSQPFYGDRNEKNQSMYAPRNQPIYAENSQSQQINRDYSEPHGGYHHYQPQNVTSTQQNYPQEKLPVNYEQYRQPYQQMTGPVNHQANDSQLSTQSNNFRPEYLGQTSEEKSYDPKTNEYGHLHKNAIFCFSQLPKNTRQKK